MSIQYPIVTTLPYTLPHTKTTVSHSSYLIDSTSISTIPKPPAYKSNNKKNKENEVKLGDSMTHFYSIRANSYLLPKDSSWSSLRNLILPSNLSRIR